MNMTPQLSKPRVLDQALSYAAQGWLVFPCHQPLEGGGCTCLNRNCQHIGKHPRTVSGLKDASTDTKVIRDWLNRWPQSNLAVVTGCQSGIFVIDIDGPEGEDVLSELEAANTPLPLTRIACTGRGRHLYFQYPEGQEIRNSAGRVGLKIDVRGEGGYVLLPPSLHASGRVYAWEDQTTPIAPAPQWLFGLMAQPVAVKAEVIPLREVSTQQQQYAKRALQNACDVVASAPEGTRNDTLNREAFGIGTLIGAGALGQYEAEGTLLDAAVSCGLSESEARKTLQSGLSHGIQQPRGLSTVGTTAPSIMQNHTEPPSLHWQAPQEIPKSIPAVEPFDPDLLPDAFRPWVVDIAERMQCPMDFPAVAALVSVSALVGRKIAIHPKAKDNWLVVPNLWGMAVGRPSLKKSPALKEAIKQLQHLETEARRQFESENLDWEAEQIVQEEREKALKKKVKEALGKESADPYIHARELVQDKSTKKPTRKRYIVNDTTVEMLGALLSENPNGLMMSRDELSGFLNSFNKQGRECDRAFYLECWNGDDRFTYDRIGRGTVEIEAACLSIIGSIQPGPLSFYLRDAITGGKGDDGFLQRFQLAVWPDSPKEWVNIDRFPDNEAKTKAFEIFKTLDKLTAECVGAIAEGFQGIPCLRFSEEAQPYFNEWLTELELSLLKEVSHPALEAHRAKYRSLIPAISLLLHLVDGGVGPVSLVSLKRACAWGEYLESHAKRIYSSGTTSAVFRAESLSQHIKKGDLPSPFSVRDVQRHGWSGLTENVDVKEALELLEEAWFVQKITEPTQGRPKEAYYINPSLIHKGEVDHG